MPGDLNLISIYRVDLIIDVVNTRQVLSSFSSLNYFVFIHFSCTELLSTRLLHHLSMWMCSLTDILTGWHTKCFQLLRENNDFLIFFLPWLTLGETVVTNAKHMSEDWKSGGSQSLKPGTRVADYVKAGCRHYSLLSGNCHHGSKRMIAVGKWLNWSRSCTSIFLIHRSLLSCFNSTFNE